MSFEENHIKEGAMAVDFHGKKSSGTVYTPFKRLARNQTHQKVVQALVMKNGNLKTKKKQVNYGVLTCISLTKRVLGCMLG